MILAEIQICPISFVLISKPLKMLLYYKVTCCLLYGGLSH